MNLTIQDIEYFLMVVEHGQLSRAAAACAVSQPALSKSLRRLEDETGLQLFERTTRSMRLTSAGMVFAEHARKLRAEYGDAVRHANELKLGKTGLLRIGATGATMDAYVMPALAELLPRRPALRVAFTIDLSDSLYSKVEQGELDIAVAPTFTSQPLALTQTPVGKDVLHVAARRHHPLQAKAALQLGDLVGHAWILPKPQALAYRRLAALFADAGLPLPHGALEIDLVSKGCLDLIARTDLLTLVAAPLITPEVAARIAILPIDVGLTREIALLTRRNATWTPLMQEFRTTLENVMAQDRANG